MYIIHIASELAPIAKVGGLADVVYGLSRELARHGHRVEILLPKYDVNDYSCLKHLKATHREIWVLEGSERYNNTVWSAELDGLNVLLLEPHHRKYYFSRNVIYGAPDDIDRFAYFSRAALEFLYQTERNVDAIHLHDWPTALIAPLYQDIYKPLGYKAGGTVLTLHNLEHQGKCSPQNLTRIGLSGENYLRPDKMQDPHSPALINLLKGGIIYADALTTVSPTYEREIETPLGGFGLNETLVQYKDKLRGILNGIDTTYWDPTRDPLLVAPYPTDKKSSLDQLLAAKAENRRYLRTHFGLAQEDRPLIAAVTRLAAQKGPLLLQHAVLRTLDKGGQFALLGSSSSPEILAQFKQLQLQLANTQQAAFCFDKNEALAHLLFAAADMFIIPSIFEPCGLTQMIALRYGAVPIARTTGGLADTIFDIDTSTKPLVERNGYTFDFPDTAGVNWALDRAIDCYRRTPKKWRQIIEQGLAYDFSWGHSALAYLKVYKNLPT